MSWIQNEMIIGPQAREFEKLELVCPLPLRRESEAPKVLYYEWQKLLIRDDVSKIVLPMRDEVYQAYEQLVQTHRTTTLEGLTQH